MLLAAIDIGSNSTRLLIAEYAGGPIVEIIRDLDSPRLGHGMGQIRRISPEALTRVIISLKSFQQKLQHYPIQGLQVVATSALRDAINRDWVLESIKAETGLNVLVLSGAQEAQLSYWGASTVPTPKNREKIVVDIGGGSTELIYPSAQGLQFQSVNLGAVRLQANQALEKQVSRILQDLIVAPLPTSPVLIGLGGTITTLAAIKLRLTRYSQQAVEGLDLSLADIQIVYQQLSAMSLSQRQNVPGLPPDRADIILGGILILQELMIFLKTENVFVSEKNILYGLIMALGWNLF